jgi:uncharacterized membrane protein YuzA (DUF378 family)
MGFEVIFATIFYVILGLSSLIGIFALAIYQTFKSLFQLVRVKKDNNHDHAN